jgi:hypothetical protein
MSRAFVKEAEDKVEELPDRPISGYRNLATHEGLIAIEAALAGFAWTAYAACYLFCCS